jgi:hypothetical protein
MFPIGIAIRIADWRLQIEDSIADCRLPIADC